MTLRNMVRSRAAMVLTGTGLQTAKRGAFEARRRMKGQPRVVQYFHDVADPYCHVSLQLLALFQKHYDIKIEPFLISGPTPENLPAPEAYLQNALTDTRRWANRLGLTSPAISKTSESAIAQASRRLAAELHKQDFTSRAQQISSALWSGEDIPEGPQSDYSAVQAAGDQALAEVGHFLGGCFAYGGECYWGPDRLAYLETRLDAFRTGPQGSFIVPEYSGETPNAEGQELEFFFSFRSPYSYLAFDRVRELAARSGAKLVLRPVLPMLMRGLPVPKVKSSYILRDCAREARRLDIPFGCISDPLGAGVERGYALFDLAEESGRLAEYCSAFMTAVWSQGIDASTDTGLSDIAAMAGLDWAKAKTQLSNTNWSARVEANQDRLQQIGLWGVPSFHLNGQTVWGQDRLWVLEDLMRSPK